MPQKRMTQIQKGQAFKALHHSDTPFIIANAWDAGSAQLLAQAGYKAIATTSAGAAFSHALQDYNLGRGIILSNAQAIVDATELPISADLENGFGPKPDICAETIRMAAKIGLVGGSIEDATNDKDAPLYEISQSVDRIIASVSAARALPFDFTITARAENFLVGRPDLSDVITRLQAYQDAGADVLYAPGLSSLDDIRTVCASVDRPVNVLASPTLPEFTLDNLALAGAQRISVGSTYARKAYGDLFLSARAVLQSGIFSPFKDIMAYDELSDKFKLSE